MAGNRWNEVEYRLSTAVDNRVEYMLSLEAGNSWKWGSVRCLITG